MDTKAIGSTGVDGTIKEIFRYFRHNRDQKVIYFYGWGGFGTAPVLRSMAQELLSIKDKKSPPELCFDTIIYIDCSAWESRRVMQRKIAEELKLDHKTMAMFDKQDEEDEFNGVDHGSRDVVPSVSQVIAQSLVNRKFMMIFLNGSDDEVDVSRFGISPNNYLDHVIVWTFKRRSLIIDAHHDEIASKLRHTQLFVYNVFSADKITSSDFLELLYHEAANIVSRQSWMRGIDLIMVTDCCLFELFLQYSFHSTVGFDWVVHAPNFWTCDGIIKGDTTRKISDTLHQEIRWVCDASVLAKLMKDLEAPFLVLRDATPIFGKRPCRWVSVTSKNLTIQEDTRAVLERASSVFVALDNYDNSQALPNGLFRHFINIGVLILSHCAFSFISPPFVQCSGLRFLGLDHCIHDNTSEGEKNTNWVWLQSLRVLDIRYTKWDEILTKENMDIMAQIRELNIEGHMCWQLTSRIQGRLPCLQKLRITKPTHKAETTSIDCYCSPVDKIDLETLDLSGNTEMKNLPECLSMAKSLQILILDGCDALENVVVSDGLCSSLRSFSFDGYGPITHYRTSFLPLASFEPKQPSGKDQRTIKASKISLQGCKKLETLFIRGLPNLVELDLSGCQIMVLDLTTMVVNVPGLKRLFLLGCENLRAIIWGSIDSMKQLKLELLCIDTRPKGTLGFTRPSLAKHKHFRLQLHAILADVRLARSLYLLVFHYAYQRGYEDIYFHIHVTSSEEYGRGVQLETTGKYMAKPSIEPQEHVQVSRYGYASSKIGDAPMLVFPQPPTGQLDRHIQISDGSHGLESELAHPYSFNYLVEKHAESLHEHDALTSASMPAGRWMRLRWCRLERCPNMVTVFPPDAEGHDALQTVWASDLLKANCIWSKGSRDNPFSLQNLQHLQLRSCPRLQFVLPVWVQYFPSLKTLHIIHCGDLTHIFVLEGKYPAGLVPAVLFPQLTTIHLHDLPKLQQICEVKMFAPALQTIRMRGCFRLRRLPTLLGGSRGVTVKKPTVEMEKDVWDALEWDGLAAGHHPDLFEPPVHSRYYRRRRLLRGTVLR
ncbi:unnamed protein product [Urochloa decumbens]|uniref:Disease resistance protein At4g27190-like leucine-rich repeats domain-containing protein n=1 Tax=Urochloa decumbens TaxID=240449 RepID=A0ABC9CZ98_9POAL